MGIGVEGRAPKKAAIPSVKLSLKFWQNNSLVPVDLLGPLVERDALGSTVDLHEARDVELHAGLLHGAGPLAELGARLAGAHLLGHHLVALVEHEVLLHE